MTVQPGSPSALDSAIIDPDAETISGAPAPVTPSQEVEFYKRAQLEHALEVNKQNLGVLGKFFGSNRQTPVHVAAVVIGVCFLLLVISFFVDFTDISQIRGHLITLISSALAYIFGSQSK